MFTERADKLRPGHSLKSPGDGVPPVADVGAMISGERFPGLQHAIQEAVDQGATLTVGGEPWVHPYLEKGSYFKPTLLGDVNPDSSIAQMERKCSLCQCLSAIVEDQYSLRPHRPYHQVQHCRASDRDCERHALWSRSQRLRTSSRRLSQGCKASAVRHGRD